MSNIPTDIKNIIDSTVFAPWYTDEGNIIFRKGAEFGYSLAIERIEGLEKEVERLRKVAANAFHEFRRAIKDGKQEITFVHLYERLMNLDSPLTPIERLLLAAMVKRISISPVTIPSIAFAADMYIDMEKKQKLEEFQ